MRRDRVAEYLVSLVAPPERAASAVGDLIEEAGERQAVRSVLNGRRIAYLGGLAAATAAGAAGDLVFATRTRRARLAG